MSFELSPYRKKGGRLRFRDSQNGNYDLYIEPEHVTIMKQFMDGLVGEVVAGLSGVVKRFADGAED